LNVATIATVRMLMWGLAVEHSAAMALMKHSPNPIADCHIP
jgi:hypothetical protein